MIRPGNIDPASAIRRHHNWHYIAAELGDAGIARFTSKGVVQLPPGIRGKIVRAYHIGGSDSDGTGNQDFIIHKKLARGNGRVAAVPPEQTAIPIMSAAKTIAINTPAGTYTDGVLAPDETESAATRGAAQAGAAGSITLAAGASALTDYYANSMVFNLATGEGRAITTYNGGTKVATVSPNWTLGNPAAGTPYKIIHDNLIVRRGDSFWLTLTGAGLGTQPTLNDFIVAILEIDDNGTNNFAS